jgi:hypothetical protein
MYGIFSLIRDPACGKLIFSLIRSRSAAVILNFAKCLRPCVMLQIAVVDGKGLVMNGCGLVALRENRRLPCVKIFAVPHIWGARQITHCRAY